MKAINAQIQNRYNMKVQYSVYLRDINKASSMLASKLNQLSDSFPTDTRKIFFFFALFLAHQC